MDLSLLSIVSSFILLLCTLYCLVKSRKNETGIPPGSTGLPLVGETLDYVSACARGVPERFVFDRREKYSSNVFRTSLFGENIAVLCGAEANKFVYLNENKLVKSWWPRRMNAILGQPGDDLGEMAAKTHAILSPYFRPSALEKSVPIIDAAIKQHLQTFWHNKDFVVTSPLVSRCVCSLTSTLFLGIDDQETVATIDHDFAQLWSGLYSLPVNFPGFNFNRALKAKERLLKAFQGFLQRMRTDFCADKMVDFKSVVEEILRGSCDDRELSTKIFGLFFVSYHTTSSALSSVIMFLGRNPHVCDKVLAEQREIKRSKGEGEVLNLRDIQEMKYSWNVVREVLRINPIVAGTFREAMCDFTYDGFLIPKGWKVHLSMNATHKNSDYFKDPEKFDPERFEKDGLITPFSHVPFGGGPRLCPGRDYAKIIMLAFMHNLVTNFRWKNADSHEKIVYDPSSRPAKSLPIHLYPQER